MMNANSEYKEYTYKTELEDGDEMMLGIILEETDRHHNLVSFCNEVFGIFNEKSQKARTQAMEYLKANYKLTTDSYPYKWVNVNEWAYL